MSLLSAINAGNTGTNRPHQAEISTAGRYTFAGRVTLTLHQLPSIDRLSSYIGERDGSHAVLELALDERTSTQIARPSRYRLSWTTVAPEPPRCGSA